MSLLEGGAHYEDCVVYPELTHTDTDGNTVTRAASVGIPAKARFQVFVQSGTSARRAEQQEVGFQTEQLYKVRFPRSFEIEIGSQGQIEWHGERWAVFGKAQRYRSSRRTAHTVYFIRRS